MKYTPTNIAKIQYKLLVHSIFLFKNHLIWQPIFEEALFFFKWIVYLCTLPTYPIALQHFNVFFQLMQLNFQLREFTSQVFNLLLLIFVNLKERFDDSMSYEFKVWIFIHWVILSVRGFKGFKDSKIQWSQDTWIQCF